MANEQDRDREFRYQDYSADGELFASAQDRPVEPDKEPSDSSRDRPVDCPACRGTGKVLLLVSTRSCEACGGMGKIAPARPPASSTDPPPADHGQARSAGSTDSTDSPQAGPPPGISPPPVVRRSYGYPDGEEEGDGGLVEMAEERVTGHWMTTTTFDAQDRVCSQTEEFVPDVRIE